MFEQRGAPLLPVRHFALRLGRFGFASLGIVSAALALGAVGYHSVAGLPWIDALLNAAMILTGMGPVDRMETTAGKLFATAYALFSGLAFVSTAGVLFAPIVHRLFHHFHLELEAGESKREIGTP